MGRKRQRDEDSDADIRRKIKKLERKLERKLEKKPRRRIIEYSSEEEDNRDVIMDVASSSTSPQEDRLRSVVSRALTSHSYLPAEMSPQPTPPRSASPVPSTSAAVNVPTENPVKNPAEGLDSEDVQLDEDILLLLGDAPKPETALGKPIHKDVASRWHEVLMKGLQKEVKDKLVEQYLIPSNCELLLAPTLNPEVKAALPDALIKRDFSLMSKQKQLGVALSALSDATELILSNESSKQKVLKPISDACRLLCDSHFTDTKMRRNFVISATNTSLKETLIDTVRDRYLFGDNIPEKLKAAKAIQRSGEVLKHVQKPKTNFVPNANNKNRFNFKAQPRKSYKSNNRDGIGSIQNRPNQRQSRNGPSKTASARSPPPAPRRTTRRP